MKKVVSMLWVLVVLSACGPSIYDTYSYSKEYDPRKHEYVIGVADQINVSVYKSADLSAVVSVRPDGVITLPLVGDVLVAGKTPSQVRAELMRRLSEYVRDAMVSVTVIGFNSYRFTVSGNVNRAGTFSQKYYVTVSEAVAMAGGPNKFAGDQIVILRVDKNHRLREIPVSYKMILSGKRPDMDIAIVSGDNITIQ